MASLYILVVIFLTFAVVSGDYFAITRTPLALDEWTLAEITFINKLKFSQSAEIYKDEDVQNYISDFENTVKTLRNYEGSLENRVQAITSNPVATFRMVRRIVKQLTDIKLSYEFDDETLFEHFPRNRWLENLDVDDAIVSILRVCHFYDLQAVDFANGIIAGQATGVTLNALECFEIGAFAVSKEYHYQAIDWLKFAVQKANDDGTIDLNTIYPTLQDAISKHDAKYAEATILNLYIFNERISPIMETITDTSKLVPHKYQLLETYKGKTSDAYNEVNYLALCAEGNLQTEKEKKELYCWYESQKNLYFIIAPLKMEWLSRNPEVLQIYEAIGEEKINRLKELGGSNMKLSGTVDLSDGVFKNVYDEKRSSVNGWVFENFYPDLFILPRTIEKITGLNVFEESSSDMMQVASYTFGGHYVMHIDAFVELKDDLGIRKGDRIATFMYYLEEPELGGATAFPQGKVAAKPIKGSAVFWYDVYKDGSANFNTFHAACPVILGRKWIANKWIRYYDQFLNHKCSLVPKENFKMFP